MVSRRLRLIDASASSSASGASEAGVAAVDTIAGASIAIGHRIAVHHMQNRSINGRTDAVVGLLRINNIPISNALAFNVAIVNWDRD